MDIDESWLIPDPSAEPPLKKFAPEEMLTCDGCLRANPPNRGQCMYCGSPLQPGAGTPDVEAEPVGGEARPGHYVVVRARAAATITNDLVERLAARFGFKPEELQAALAIGAPLPVTSAPSEESASRIVAELADDGVETISVSDIDLKTSLAPFNIRSLEFSDSGITAISKNGRDRPVAQWSDLHLIVTGRLLTHRVEVDERRSGSAIKPLDRREISEDKSVMDLYAVSSEVPWRIVVSDFDFSCLGEHKSLTAFDNAATLIGMLAERSNSELNDSYGRVKSLIAHVWSLENTSSESRSRRPRASRKDFATVNISSNEAQFNNYSRLMWCLKLQELNS